MIITFLYSLAGGMLAILATGPIRLISWRFLRVVTTISLALSAGACAWLLARGQRPFSATMIITLGLGGLVAVSACILLVLAPLAERMTKFYRWTVLLAGISGICAACIHATIQLKDATDSFVASYLLITSQILGSLLLGSITLAWLLGHAYLTATSMTIAPLRHFSRMLSWSVAVRALFIVASLATAYLLRDASDGLILLRLQSSWLIASLRIGLGVVAVGVFTYMVSDCVRLRATQSATGILYFASIFAYIGELAALQLVLDLQWPA